MKLNEGQRFDPNTFCSPAFRLDSLFPNRDRVPEIQLLGGGSQGT